MLPRWADGGSLLVHVPLSTLFMVRQPTLVAPCGHLRIPSPDRISLSSSQAYGSASVSSYSLRSEPASFSTEIFLWFSDTGITASSHHLSLPLSAPSDTAHSSDFFSRVWISSSHFYSYRSCPLLGYSLTSSLFAADCQTLLGLLVLPDSRPMLQLQSLLYSTGTLHNLSSLIQLPSALPVPLSASPLAPLPPTSGGA